MVVLYTTNCPRCIVLEKNLSKRELNLKPELILM